MSRVKGGLFTGMLDVNKRFPLDSRMLVSKREDLINPKTWITNTLTTEATYNSMIVFPRFASATLQVAPAL